MIKASKFRVQIDMTLKKQIFGSRCLPIGSHDSAELAYENLLLYRQLPSTNTKGHAEDLPEVVHGEARHGCQNGQLPGRRSS